MGNEEIFREGALCQLSVADGVIAGYNREYVEIQLRGDHKTRINCPQIFVAAIRVFYTSRVLSLAVTNNAID